MMISKGTKRKGQHPRWIRESQLPFSAHFAKKLHAQGLLPSALLQIPGSSRTVRVFDGDALDSYLERVAAEQFTAEQAQRKGVATA